MDLTQKIENAKAKLAAAQGKITVSDESEISARIELSEIEAQTEEVERKQLELNLARRVDVAREKLGPESCIEGLMIQEFSDTFIVARDGKAHAKWQKDILRLQTAQAQGGRYNGPDRDAIGREYAVKVVYDWNGITDFDENTESSAKLRKYLSDNPGLIIPITDLSAKLSGVFAEERKSGAK